MDKYKILSQIGFIQGYMAYIASHTQIPLYIHTQIGYHKYGHKYGLKKWTTLWEKLPFRLKSSSAGMEVIQVNSSQLS